MRVEKKKEKTEFSKKEKVAIQLDYGVRSIGGAPTVSRQWAGPGTG